MEEAGTGKGPKNSRKTFLAGIGILSLFSFLKISLLAKKRNNAIDCAPPGSRQTAKLLTQDGNLVEVDISKIRKLKKKITDQELQNWIRKQ